MKLAAYLRVSTDRQAEEGLGLEVQEQTIKGWAHAHEHRVVLWTRDEGVSGSNGLDTRVGLADVPEAIKRQRVDGLVVYRLDRLARDLVLQEQLLAEIRRLGGELFSTSNAEASYLSDDPDDPSRKLIRQVLGAVNEHERAMIALRLRSGRRRKADNGGYAFGEPRSAIASRGASSSRIRPSRPRSHSCARCEQTATRTDRSPRHSKFRGTHQSAARPGIR